MQNMNNQDSNIYRRIIDDSYDSICVTDKDGRFIIANKATAECMQLPLEEIIGKTPQELLKKDAYNISTIIEAMETKKKVTGLVTLHGTNRLSTSTPLLDSNGNVEYVVTNNRSDVIIDEFSMKLAYEKERHNHFKNIAKYLSNQQTPDIFFNSPKMAIILNNCKVVAETDTSVLINGESGSGKELIAKYIHKNSPRKNQPFIAVNCSTIPPDLFESEFFGYRPGSFTGANTKGKSGLLQMAHKGTLFLDELGELPPLIQAKFLRFTETGEFFPIGSTKSEHVDVRIIAATNQDLPKMIQENKFRSDLYYRLNIFPVHLPPLRERPEDIEVIAKHYIEVYNKKYKKNTLLSWQNLLLLRKYPWPGNVRELKNVIERGVLMSPNDETELSLISILYPNDTCEHHTTDSYAVNSSLFSLPSLDLPLSEAMEQLEQQYIKAVIDYHNGNIPSAAKSLSVHRTTLYRKLNHPQT